MPRLLKLSFSLGFWGACWLWRGFQSALGRELGGTFVALCYHGVSREQRSRFARQMDDLRKLTKPVRADTQMPLQSGIHHAAVTFDDGLVSVIENALPELAQRKIPSTIFVPTGYLGQRSKWIKIGVTKRDRDQLLHDAVMTADQLAHLGSDLVAVGSHGVTHRSLSALAEDEARRELVESKHGLELVLGRDVTLLSFPRGAYDQKVLRWAREAGYRRVFTIFPTMLCPCQDQFVAGRVCVEPTDWRLEFRLKLLGAYRWVLVGMALRQRIRGRFSPRLSQSVSVTGERKGL